jgi:2-dehydro-3-deoxygluconokinase
MNVPHVVGYYKQAATSERIYTSNPETAAGQGRMAQFVTFGEIMLRLNTPGFRRFLQAESFEASYGGAEASVAISLVNYGISSAFVTCLPPNEIGQAAINYVRRFGVDTSHITRAGERIGIYFYEIGANQRPSKVIYDRAHSAIADVKPGSIPWKEIFSEAKWFHFTGITPAISQNAADVCLEAVRSAKDKGLTVSCDLNYRAKLWKYGKTATEIMAELMPYVDIVCGNEEDCEKIFGIKGADVRIAEEVSPEKYSEVAGKLVKRFPNLKRVGITLRGSISATHNTWSAVLYDGKLHTTSKYDITSVVDRLGGGDAFTGALVYCLLAGKSDQDALDFATAASALKHSILFDPNLASIQEIESLVKEGGAGRVQR